MIVLSLLSWGGGLGFSLLVGLVGVFYLNLSKSRLEYHQDSHRKSDVVEVFEDQDIKVVDI